MLKGCSGPGDACSGTGDGSWGLLKAPGLRSHNCRAGHSCCSQGLPAVFCSSRCTEGGFVTFCVLTPQAGCACAFLGKAISNITAISNSFYLSEARNRCCLSGAVSHVIYSNQMFVPVSYLASGSLFITLYETNCAGLKHFCAESCIQLSLCYHSHTASPSPREEPWDVSVLILVQEMSLRGEA